MSPSCLRRDPRLARRDLCSAVALLLFILCFPPKADSQGFTFNRTDYAKPSSYCVGNITVGDFLRDGKPDLVFACGSTLGIMRNTGQGAFADVVYYPIPLQDVGIPSSLTAADFNGDGMVDLALQGVAPYPGQVLLMMGNGDGTFQTATTLATIFGAFVSAGDFNNDGKPDLAVANWRTAQEPCGVYVLLNNGAGSFEISPLMASGGSTQSLALADLNGDGFLDIVVLNDSWFMPPAKVGVLINQGNGTFAPAVTYEAGPSPVGLVVADLNGDVRPDIAIASNDQTVRLLIAQEDGTFVPGASLAVPYPPVSITAADFNRDGAVDLATVANTFFPVEAITILPGNSDGSFGTPVGLATDYWAFFITNADLNGDGYPDLLTANSLLGSVSVFIYGTLPPQPPSPYEWIRISASGGPRVSNSGAVYDSATNELIQFGGSMSPGWPNGGSNSIWRLSNANGLGGTPEWANRWGGYIPERSDYAFAYDAEHSRFMIHAGSSGWQNRSDSWVLANANARDGNEEWLPLPSGGPTVRSAGAGYDPVSNRFILFGGVWPGCYGGCPSSNEVWILTGANGTGDNPNWSLLPTVGTPPSPRYYAGVAYDQGSNRLIVTGGLGEGGYATDVWVLTNANGVGTEPSQWIQLLASGAPLRYAPLYAHDPTHNRLFLVGGEKRMCHWFCPAESDVWVLHHANGLGGVPRWRQLRTAEAQPPGRFYAVGAYDSIESRLILSGGVNTSGYLEDTWVLTNLNIPDNEPPIAEAGLSRDAIVGEKVAFDGVGSVDPDGIITSYHWQFGDDEAADGSLVEHAFSSAGQFTVTLTVSDDIGETASDSATVTVITTAQAIASLSNLVASYNLRQGISNSLDQKLQNALAALQAANAGQRQDATNKLNAFILAVQAQRGKELSSTQADELIVLANRILSVI